MILTLQDFNKTTVGEWIDRDEFIRNNDIVGLATHLYSSEIPLDFVKYEICVGAWNSYLEWRQNIMDNYAAQFIHIEEGKSKIIYDRLGITDEYEEIEEMMSQQQKEYNRNYGWYDILFTEFANCDYLKMSACFHLTMIEVLNHKNYLLTKPKS